MPVKKAKRPPKEVRVLAKVTDFDLALGIAPRWKDSPETAPLAQGLSVSVIGEIASPPDIKSPWRKCIEVTILTAKGMDDLKYLSPPTTVGFYHVSRSQICAIVTMEYELVKLMALLLAQDAFPWINMEMTWPKNRQGEVISFTLDRSVYEADWPM